MTDSERLLKIGKIIKVGDDLPCEDALWLVQYCATLRNSLASAQKHLEYYTQQSHRQYEDRRDYLDYEEDDRR